MKGKIFGWSIVGLVVIVALSFFFNSLGLGTLWFFGPKVRKVENWIWKQSEQYQDGMVRDMEELRMDYLNDTPEQKLAIRSTILHRFSVFPKDKMTPELQSFYDQLQRGDNQ